MNERQLGILRHALGLTRAKTAYRNHYVTGPGSIDFDDCEALVRAGLMTRRDPNDLWGGDFCFTVTDAGKRTASQPDAAPSVAALYNELLYAVEKKYPGESRHDTALRYIRDRETLPAIESQRAASNGSAGP